MVQNSVKAVLVILVICAIAFVGYKALNMPDQRTVSEKMGDAVDAIGDGADKAARQLENRTPGEKLEDAVKDVSDNIKEKNRP